MVRTELELALRGACAELSGPTLELAWSAANGTVEATRPARSGGAPVLLARCAIERTDAGLVARLEPPGRRDARDRRLERGYSLVCAPEKLWRRWTDGAELTDDDLGAEIVGWTFRLAMDRGSAAVP